MTRRITIQTMAAVALAVVLAGASAIRANAEDIHWDPTQYGTSAAPLSWHDTSKWLNHDGTPAGAVPTNGQSIALADSCCNPEPYINIDLAGAGVNLPNSTIRFDAKTNLVDSTGSADPFIADIIRFNGAGGGENDVHVPVIANTFTSNRHGAHFHAPITVDTILANSSHQDKWEINVSPTGPLLYIDLDENRGADGGSIDGKFTVNADLTVATLDHVWSRLIVGPGATLTVGTYNVTDYSGNAPNDNAVPLVLNGQMTVGTFNFGGADQGTGTWGGIGSGADTELGWITGSGLVTVAAPPGPGGAIPEPMTMLAVGLGISGLGGYIRKRRRA